MGNTPAAERCLQMCLDTHPPRRRERDREHLVNGLAEMMSLLPVPEFPALPVAETVRNFDEAVLVLYYVYRGSAGPRPVYRTGRIVGLRVLRQDRTWIVENMSKRVSTVITDDLDGSSGAEAIRFSIDGLAYEIDLGPANRERMHASLRPFIDAGRRMGVKKSAGRKASRTDLAAVRAWAVEQGLNVAERGRISADVMTKYDAAH